MPKKKVAAEETTSTTNNEVIVSGFNAVSDVDLTNMMSEEFDGLDISFDRIKIPTGGGTSYKVPGDDPEKPDTVDEFSAVILYHHPLQVYYKEKFNGKNAPPDCISFDGNVGEGTPGGDCKNCPLNAFGSAEDEKGKACKARRSIYILREGEIFPLLLSLPTLSLKPFTRYIMNLYSKGGRASNSVVTRFTLKEAVSSGGYIFSQAQFKAERNLTPEEKEVIAKLSEQVKNLSKSVTVQYKDTIDDETVIPVNIEYIPAME